ncbi:MAG: NuoM family protein [Alphaproteobacteria bacterium]
MGISALLIVLPVLGAAITALIPTGEDGRKPLVSAIASTGIFLLFALFLALRFEPSAGEQFTTRIDWVPEIGVTFHLGLDGPSILMVLLTALLSLVALLAIPGTMERVSRSFLVWFLLMQASVVGVFLARDWFLFYLFWEVALIPMFFLIGIWGGPRRGRAAYSFFLYTLAGSLVMLVGLMAAYVEAVAQQAPHGFEMITIASAMQKASPQLQSFVFICVFLGMAVKVPVFPLHGWLPSAHVEAPVPVSIMLSGVLLKMGGYGLLRLAEMVPSAVAQYGVILLSLGIITVIYGAVLAFRQDDLKAMVAYSSVNHMGFVLIGIASLTEIGLRGATVQMFSHGLVTAALFFLVGLVYKQTHSRSLIMSSGIAKQAPKFTIFMTITLLASMGLPGLSGFVGEFQVLMGGYGRWGLIVALAGLGILVTTIYSLRVFGWMVLQPKKGDGGSIRDLGTIELVILVPLAALMILLGLFPSIIADLITSSTAALAYP